MVTVFFSSTEWYLAVFEETLNEIVPHSRNKSRSIHWVARFHSDYASYKSSQVDDLKMTFPPSFFQMDSLGSLIQELELFEKTEPGLYSQLYHK